MQRWVWISAAGSTVLVLVFVAFTGTNLGWWSLQEPPAETAGGPLDWMEPASWIAGILSLLVAIYAAWQAARLGMTQNAAAQDPAAETLPQGFVKFGNDAYETTALARAGAGLLAMSGGTPRVGEGAGEVPRSAVRINQHPAREALEAHLSADRSSVIAVYGGPGVGKSALVRWVTSETSPTPKWYHLFRDNRLDVMTLIRAIAHNPQAPNRLRDGEEVMSRLEAALEADDGPPVTIVLDGVQHLLKRGKSSLQDLRLEEALRKIASGRKRRVKVILIGDRAPELIVGAYAMTQGGYERR